MANQNVGRHCIAWPCSLRGHVCLGALGTPGQGNGARQAQGVVVWAGLGGGSPGCARGLLTGQCCSSCTGHGNFPYLCGNLNDVVVSPLLYTCYQNSQSVSRAYEQYGAPALQPISEEMQLLLTVYYLVQLGESLPVSTFWCSWVSPSPPAGTSEL